MPNLYDIAYGVGLGAAAPYWLLNAKARRKVRKALRERMARAEVTASAAAVPCGAPVVMIHAVSLGEINAIRGMVQSITLARPDVRFVVSVTTETGYARGKELYGSASKVTLIRYPLDFSGPVRRVLDAVAPRVVVLMELEVWPNFILHCHRRGIPVLLVNGRLTTYSFRNYGKLRALLAPTFRRLAVVCAQDRTFADRFIYLGTPADRVRVTGTMKFDTAQIAGHIEGQDELAKSLGLGPAAGPIWVCGSTGPGEEAILLRCYQQLLAARPTLRLVLVPRHPERFDEVAKLICHEGFEVLRRSEHRAEGGLGLPLSATPIDSPLSQSAIDSPRERAKTVVLGDTMGELRKFYSLATVVFVGRSLVDLGPRQHGSDMIEPAALAKPVVIGPWTQNFADAMSRFSQAGAMKIVVSEAELAAAIGALLCSPEEAGALGLRARDVVRLEQGATARHVELILQYLPPAATGNLVQCSPLSPSPGSSGEGGGEGVFLRDEIESPSPQPFPGTPGEGEKPLGP